MKPEYILFIYILFFGIAMRILSPIIIKHYINNTSKTKATLLRQSRMIVKGSIILILFFVLLWGLLDLFILKISNDFFVNIVIIIIAIGISFFIPAFAIQFSIMKKKGNNNQHWN